ncbi:MAG: hypothetical protein LC798_11240 [Chloroflexi bacterium]|nr:hypothetical protein [Chloroflexota bacterium]
MTTDQAFGTFAGPNGGTCAVGAAIDALGGDPGNGWDVHVIDRVLNKRVDLSGSLPCDHRETAGNTSVSQAIYHLNDIHRMPRNEIADWLSGLGSVSDRRAYRRA